MAEEIVASPTAFANGENESDEKEFAVAGVEKEETFDRDAEIVASPTAFANGENESDEKEFAVAGVEKEETFDRDAAAASGVLDLAIQRLIQECLNLNEWYRDYQLNLSDPKANPALEARRKELELEEARFLAELEESRRRSDVIDGLFEKLDRLVKEFRLSEGLRVSEQKAQNIAIDNAAPAEEEELRSDQVVDVEEKNLQNRDMQGGVSGSSLPQALALGIASAVGVVAGTLGTLVCLYVAKRK